MTKKNLFEQHFSNLVEIIDFIDENYQNQKAFNFRQNEKWVNISTQEFVNNVKKLSLALKEIGLKKGDGFSIISHSNPFWLIMDFAALSAGAVSVPIFSNISRQNLIFQTEDANVQFIFCDNKENFEFIKNSGKKFKKIITDGFATDDKDVVTFEQLLKIGEKLFNKKDQLAINIKEDDLATIIYTSGSTGRPKGVSLTHKNVITQIKATKQLFPLDDKTDKAVSFLPLAHIFERLVSTYYITSGVSVYFVDDINNIGKIIQEIKPTIMTMVPRLLEKIFSKMKANLDEASLLKRIIGGLAFKYALHQNPDSKKGLRYKIFDRLVYQKLRAAIGGKFKYLICGSAPLTLSLEKFYKNIGINLFIGYGLTESTAVISANYPNNNKLSTVGKAFPEIEVKIANDGELLAKGEAIMKGYHNNKKQTEETFDNGWLKTGDLATIDEEGYIKIIGRKKELFKTSTGKYVSPVPIEQKLVRLCDFLSAACIIAEGRKFVSCLLFVDFDILPTIKKKVGKSDLSNEDFLRSEFVNTKIEKLIKEVNHKLNYWEQIKKYHLSNKAISIEGGELTPSMKLCRGIVENKYKEVIDSFY